MLFDKVQSLGRTIGSRVMLALCAKNAGRAMPPCPSTPPSPSEGHGIVNLGERTAIFIRSGSLWHGGCRLFVLGFEYGKLIGLRDFESTCTSPEKAREIAIGAVSEMNLSSFKDEMRQNSHPFFSIGIAIFPFLSSFTSSEFQYDDIASSMAISLNTSERISYNCAEILYSVFNSALSNSIKHVFNHTYPRCDRYSMIEFEVGVRILSSNIVNSDAHIEAHRVYKMLRIAIADSDSCSDSAFGLASDALIDIDIPDDKIKILLKRMKHVDLSPLSPSYIKLISQLPTDYIPLKGDIVGWKHLCYLLPIIANFVDSGVALNSLLRGLKPDWRALSQRLFPEMKFDSASNASDDRRLFVQLLIAVMDVNTHFTNTLYSPLHAYHNNGIGRDCADINVIFDKQNLYNCVMVSRRWHAAMPVMPYGPSVAWGRYIADWSDPETGLVITQLISAQMMSDEGGSGPDSSGVMGLDHCVATYVPKAASGKSTIVSVRRPIGTSMERVSTAELMLAQAGENSSYVDVVQHQSHANANPPEDAVRALSNYVKKIQIGEIEVDFNKLESMESSGIDVEAKCGYDWRNADNLSAAVRAWEPFLPRRYRGLDLTSLYGMFAEQVSKRGNAANPRVSEVANQD
ncbi:hypothetical protein [Bosea sp. RAC05]|uniref:hypothetical protein n=1 Tax=Bosea sp. RAC05 TaxID=1842539 RepID=UPI000855CFC1|nr:hypothetical protein [Bosea sp. RAC05]AOG03466.1 hypothetical protein BSY19_4866 [Bosea sp. RAC05]